MWDSYLLDPPSWVNSPNTTIQWLEQGIELLDRLFKKGQLEESYDYHQNLTSLMSLNANLTFDQWEAAAEPILDDLLDGISNAIFENFGIEAPESEEGQVQQSAKLDALLSVFQTVFAYFFIAAGAFLLLLGVMYWFGKTRKSVGEWVSILVRTVFGICIVLFCIFAFSGSGAASSFVSSSWPIPVVMIAYFIGKSPPQKEGTQFSVADILIVIVLDNLLVWHTNQTIAKQTAHIRDPEYPLPNQQQYANLNSQSAVTSSLLEPR